jgi:hypothetical protein
MARSYRGLGLVVLMLLVVAPLTLFAIVSLFEDETDGSIKLSLDGVHWTSGVDGTLLASEAPWTPGEVRSAIVYVRNSNPAPVDAYVKVICRTTDELALDGHLTFATQVDEAPAVAFPAGASTSQVRIAGLPADSTVPVTVTAGFGDIAPIGATIDSSALRLELRIGGARTQDAGPPSLLDAAGAQLWLAPILLVGGAVVVLRVQARRRAGPSARKDTLS